MLTSTYADLLEWRCSRYSCERKGACIHVHHILPAAKGGPDEAWNYICVCSRCHRICERMSRNGFETTLFAWKALAEIRLYGFPFDERVDRDCKKLNALLHSRGFPIARYIPYHPGAIPEAPSIERAGGNRHLENKASHVGAGRSRTDRRQPAHRRQARPIPEATGGFARVGSDWWPDLRWKLQYRRLILMKQDTQKVIANTSVSFADAAASLRMSKDRLYGWMGGLGIHAIKTTGGQPGSKGGKPPVLLTQAQVDQVRKAYLRYTGKRV